MKPSAKAQVRMDDSTLTNKEEDLLSRSTHKPFTEIEASYRDTVINQQTFTVMDFDCTLFSNLTLEEEKDNTSNHPNFIPITVEDKTRLYEPWK